MLAKGLAGATVENSGTTDTTDDGGLLTVLEAGGREAIAGLLTAPLAAGAALADSAKRTKAKRRVLNMAGVLKVAVVSKGFTPSL